MEPLSFLDPLQSGLPRRSSARPSSLRGPWVAIGLLLPILLLTSPALAQRSDPVAAVTDYSGSSTDGFFHLDLGNGGVYYVDRLENNLVRTRLLGQNAFSEIGRPTDQGAWLGEILLGPIRAADGSLQAVLFVESSTGYVAFFDEPGRGSLLGKISTAIGRPFEPIASGDRHFALLMRRAGSGRTEGAYLYHGPTGRTLHLDGLRKLEPDGAVVELAAWPQIAGPVSTASLQNSREETIAYLLADPTTGVLHRVNLVSTPSRVSLRPSILNLFDAFDGEAPHPVANRLALVGLQDDSDATRGVFVADAGSGEIAVIDGIEGNAPVVRRLGQNLYDVLGREVSTLPRSLALVPGDSGGETETVYVIDSLTRQVVRVENPSQPGAVLLRNLGRIGG